MFRPQWRLFGDWRDDCIKLGEEFGHVNGCPGCFDTAVVIRIEASDFGLLFVVQKENLVNDGDKVPDGELLQCVGDGARDEFGMAGLALNHNAERDDGVDLGVLSDVFGANGDLKSSGNAVEGDCGTGENANKLLIRGLDESADKVLIIEAGDDIASLRAKRKIMS